MNAIKRPSRVLPVIAATALAVLLAGCYVHPRYTANYHGGPRYQNHDNDWDGKRNRHRHDSRHDDDWRRGDRGWR